MIFHEMQEHMLKEDKKIENVLLSSFLGEEVTKKKKPFVLSSC